MEPKLKIETASHTRDAGDFLAAKLEELRRWSPGLHFATRFK